jgi:hypothetical protein
MSSSPTEGRTGLRLAFATAALWVGLGLAHADAERAPTVRPEVGKPLQAAVELLKARKGKEALARLGEAETAPGRTAYETYLLDRVRGQAASAAGDALLAARSFEAAAASAACPAADRPPMLAAAAGQQYLAKDYAKAADLASRYVKEGGSDPAIRTLLVQSLYLGADYSRAERELVALLEAQDQAGKAATEDQLQLLASICLKQRDGNCYAQAMERLLATHPKQDYWLAAIHEVSAMPAFASRLNLDVARLKLYTRTLRTTAEYFEAAQLALQEGFPTEARDFLERGYAAGQLGTGPEADRHRRLRDMVAKAVAEDSRSPGDDISVLSASKDGTALLNAGFNQVLRGQADKGLPLMEQGLRKGGLKRPEDGKLHYGIALALAGRGGAAAQALHGIQGKDGTADLARLWAIAARRSSAGGSN